ncbi:DNA repair protein RadA [Schaalia sp. 19OD2882]|uniref:DNA repair protein RadA n=1 Tax=Schaalia sp. 19OD2882 TaxID=2794089 RepID=UPI001C1EA713|nr:DNA repair protein RadA [Schaalia sp. 19OD2882]QWW19865.1 DNA repair protein RadA [Schaalia sp. 19OD2882]
MAKGKPVHRCRECGWSSPKWVGQCRECRAWDTLDEVVPDANSLLVPAPRTPSSPALPIARVRADRARVRRTGEGEVDRVLGGGVVQGAVILLAGEPGVGKSTLLLEVASRMAGRARMEDLGPVLYVTGEESCAQVRLRAERISAMDPALLLSDDADLATILGQVETTGPSLLVVDSVQTIHATQAEGTPGGPTQVRAVAQALIRLAKTRDVPVLLVGHVTKDGGIAGPRVLEHLVDVVCQFEGDRHSSLRMLRSVKNRYGPTDEVGCFEMKETGLVGLPDPSGLFLSSREMPRPGSCATVSLEGRRPIPTEIQALVTDAPGGSPRRATSGVDSSRMAMVLAVLQASTRIPSHQMDAYVSTVGGARTNEPAADLAMAIALYSSWTQQSVDANTVAIGEVGLTGEVRSCTGVEQRLREAARLGFRHALVPVGSFKDLRPVKGITPVPVPDLLTAFEVALA